MSVQKRKIEVPKYIDSYRKVSVKLMGNVSEISISDRLNKGATIRPITKENFVVLSTGELKEFVSHANNRTENRRNLEKTMRYLSDLINANITPENISRCRFLTLTYHENQRDAQKFYSDYKRFNQKLKRYIFKKFGLCYEYIFILEAQARGSFHAHIIQIFDSAPPFLDPFLISSMWEQGFVSIKALNGSVDNIGKYLCAYLSDLPADDVLPSIAPEATAERIKAAEIEGKQKRILKGARLALIPAGVRIYRCSRGIKRPVVFQTPYSDALEYLADTGFEKVSETAFELSDTESNFKSKYIKQTYKKIINPNRKRKEKQYNE